MLVEIMDAFGCFSKCVLAMFPLMKSFITIALTFGFVIVNARTELSAKPELSNKRDSICAFSFVTQQLKQKQRALNKIEVAIQKGDFASLSTFFSSKIYVNLFTGDKGYFSAEQSFFIVKNFFTSFTPMTFSFSSNNTETTNPYGVGTLYFIMRGQKNSAQVFIALSELNSEWKISQFTIVKR